MSVLASVFRPAAPGAAMKSDAFAAGASDSYWRSLFLFNVYRLIVALLLLSVAAIFGRQLTFGSLDFELYVYVAAGYVLFSLLCFAIIASRRLFHVQLGIQVGADILFIESPETEEELATIGRTFAGVPLVVNNVEGGRTPILPPQQLQEMGFSMAIYPSLGFLAAGHALREAYQNLQDRAAFRAPTTTPALHDFQAFSLMMGFQQVWDFDRRQAELDEASESHHADSRKP